MSLFLLDFGMQMSEPKDWKNLSYGGIMDRNIREMKTIFILLFRVYD